MPAPPEIFQWLRNAEPLGEPVCIDELDIEDIEPHHIPEAVTVVVGEWFSPTGFILTWDCPEFSAGNGKFYATIRADQDDPNSEEIQIPHLPGPTLYDAYRYATTVADRIRQRWRRRPVR